MFQCSFVRYLFIYPYCTFPSRSQRRLYSVFSSTKLATFLPNFVLCRFSNFCVPIKKRVLADVIYHLHSVNLTAAGFRPETWQSTFPIPIISFPLTNKYDMIASSPLHFIHTIIHRFAQLVHPIHSLSNFRKHNKIYLVIPS